MTKRQHDIERYLRGEMTAQEMHALEKEALNDPFLSDALEGAQTIDVDSFLFDLRTLKSTVADRPDKRRPKIISMWRLSIGIAATLLFVAMSGLYLIRNLSERSVHRAENAANEEELYALRESSSDTLEIMMPRLKPTMASVPDPIRIDRRRTNSSTRRQGARFPASPMSANSMWTA